VVDLVLSLTKYDLNVGGTFAKQLAFNDTVLIKLKNFNNLINLKKALP
jgi:hypothetical protein